MLGAIAGDTIGSVYEFNNHRGTDFPLFVPNSTFTDDSVVSVATAHLLLYARPHQMVHPSKYAHRYKTWGLRYRDAGYGEMFKSWLSDKDSKPYDSFGNGSAMRVAPGGWAYETLPEVLAEASHSAEVTHNHPDGIKGAEVTAAAVFAARTGASREEIRELVGKLSDYDLNRSVDEIRKVYKFNETCQETVPEAIIAFLESTDFEDAIRKAVSMGGDSDTLACITGGIAEAFYGGVPDSIAATVLDRLDSRLRDIVRKFDRQFMGGRYQKHWNLSSKFRRLKRILG